MSDKWFPPATYFRQNYVIFLIERLDFLSEGQYPPEPPEYTTEVYDKESKQRIEITKKRSSYTQGGRRKLSKHAHFETPAMIVAELTKRIRLCKQDGLLLLLNYTFQGEDKSWIQREMARMMGVENVSSRVRSALTFISGKWPKDRSYREHYSHRKSQS